MTGLLGKPLRMTSLATCLVLALSLDVDAASVGGGQRGVDAAARATARAGPARTSAVMPDTVPHPQAAVLPVANDDGGPGTLHSVVAGTGSGDTIDLRALTCSTITLANGAIEVAVDSFIS